MGLGASLTTELIPEAELNESRITLMKHGAKTGFTKGVSTGIESLTCQPLSSSSHFVSRECCIVAEEDSLFSKVGDSGSFISDTSGRLRAMITAGLTSHQLFIMHRLGVCSTLSRYYLIEAQTSMLKVEDMAMP
jgi:hypothetical protein